MISIVIYIVIAQNVLANPKYARGLAFAETARIVLWLLVLVDLGYYFFWKKRYLAPQAILHNSQKTKLFRALQNYKGPVEERAAAVVSTFVTRKVGDFRDHRSHRGIRLSSSYRRPLSFGSVFTLCPESDSFDSRVPRPTFSRKPPAANRRTPQRNQASRSTGHEGLNRLAMFNFRFATVLAWSADAGLTVIV